MKTLEKSLRNKLEKTVKEARDVAEDAAHAALEQLGVGEPSAYPHLTEADRKLRRKLRAHGRQLGNGRNAKGEQALERLIEEVAYEHWHRMLFARFLAENNLLMYPDPDDPVAVTLEECEDLAADEGATNGWELASRYAARMLPQIFRPNSPIFQLVLPPEYQQKLEGLVNEMPQQVFTASDSLGWVYQFWQAKKKDEVNASEVKIGARELPAVTQLFTEPYMVSFLLDNSLGAWWATRRLSEADIKTASSEGELRSKAAIIGVPLEYLRFVRQEDGTWAPAAGTFESWPERLSELKTIDPCCGSGHFLVAVFLMLVPMRMELEDLTAREAVDRVLSVNIHGLELDQRCVELAAFALALSAWKYRDAGGYRPLPELNLACSGFAVSVAKKDWKTIAKIFPDKSYLPIALDWMYEVYKDAPILGSLLDPARAKVAGLVKWKEVGSAIKDMLAKDQPDTVMEAGVVAHGLAKASHLLTENYHWVITNVPYLARGKQEERLRDFCAQYYKEAKKDLATVFLDRCLELCVKGGTTSIVLPQNWLFLTSYRKFREKLLKNDTWHLIARLGPGAFETISGEVVKAILISLSRSNVAGNHGGLFGEAGPAGIIRGMDVSEPRTAAEKAAGLLAAEIKSVEQAKQLKNPACSIELDDLSEVSRVGDYAFVRGGITTGDSLRFRRCFWEQAINRTAFSHQQNTVRSVGEFSGRELCLFWEDGKGDLAWEAEFAGATIAGKEAWGRRGIAITYTGSLRCTHYAGELFENVICVMIPKKESDLPAFWSFCSSGDFEAAVRSVNQKLSVDVRYFEKAPFDLDHWTTVAEEKYPNGLPKPYSNDPTQWIFHGHPCGSVVWDEAQKWMAIRPLRTDSTVLQGTVARLLGYRWPAETDFDIELSDESRALMKKSRELLLFVDEDGIVCIPPVRGEMKAEDRLENLLAAAYGNEWSTNKKAELLAQAGHAGKTLGTWLRDKFFTQHCKLFHHRPFIWHIWDGLHDGFAALVNYHKFDAKLLETLIYTYLGDWITRQKQDVANDLDGAQEKLAVAEALKKKLELILKGEAPYDIFIRWKPTEKQPIGWNPDLNDGVRLNIRPFMTAGDVKKKDAGVLRNKPNIKWGKDRGKDVTSAPWYHLFKGDRINDHHLSLEEKHAARKQKEKDGQK